MARINFVRYMNSDTGQWMPYVLDTGADTLTPYAGDPSKIQWGTDESQMYGSMDSAAAAPAPASAPPSLAEQMAAFTPSQWATERGLGEMERLIHFQQPLPPEFMQQLLQGSSAPSGDPRDMWNDYVSRQQYNPSGGITEQLTNLVTNPANLFFAGTTGLGGMTLANAATGGDVGQGVVTDLAGLGAGAGLSQSLPALGLSTPAVAPQVSSVGALEALGLSNAGTSAAGMANWSLPAAIESGLLPAGAGAGIMGSLVAGAPGATVVPTTSAAAGSTGILSPTVTGAAGAGAATAAANAALSNSGSLPDAGMDLGAFNDGNQYTSGLDVNALTQAAQQGAASSGVTNALTNGLTTGAASGLGGLTLSKLLSGNVGLNDLASLTTLGDLGKLGAAGLGYLGSQQQSEDYSNLARDLAAREDARYADLTKREEQRFNTLQGREDEAIARQRADIDYGRLVGAPSRERYEATYAPNFNVNSLPGLQGAMDASAQSLLRGLSARGSNPYGNPGGLAEVQNYITGNVALPELNRYRTLNAQTGGYGNYAGAGASIPGLGSSLPGNVGAGSSVGTQGGMQPAAGGIGASKGMYDSIGYGLNNLFGNGDSLTNTLRSLTNSGRLKLSLT